MIIKVTRGEDFAFIDNEGEILRQVKVSGNNDIIVNSLTNILNVQIDIRFKGELDAIDPEVVVREGSMPPVINKSSNLFLTKYFKKDLELQGFEVEIIKE